MEFKGTKGKWEVRTGTFGFEKDGDYITSNHDIAKIYKGVESEEESKANALLISKAPEMLEMLKRFVESDDLQIEDFIEASQLIKEATEL